MTQLQMKKAQRSKAYLKLGIAAPSGGGKTLGALLVGYGLLKEKYPTMSDADIWNKIAIIDTENGSGELYVNYSIGNTHIGEYNAITLRPPFEADKYTDGVQLCEQNGIEVCIIDSTTHLWSGEGGLLDQQSAAARRTGNSYTAWKEITPQHNRFVSTMLQTPMHIIATMRSKQEYVQEKDDKTNKTTVRKLGLEPEQRKGMEYEFTTFFEIDAEHTAFGSKDRTSLFDQKYFKITPETGKTLMQWLDGGVDTTPVVVATAHSSVVEAAEKSATLDALKKSVVEKIVSLGGRTNEVVMKVVKEYSPTGNTNSINDEAKLTELYSKLQAFQPASVETAETN